MMKEPLAIDSIRKVHRLNSYKIERYINFSLLSQWFVAKTSLKLDMPYFLTQKYYYRLCHLSIMPLR